jgi:hypothetical protein
VAIRRCQDERRFHVRQRHSGLKDVAGSLAEIFSISHSFKVAAEASNGIVHSA